jgi:hypothetical protein
MDVPVSEETCQFVDFDLIQKEDKKKRAKE